MKKGSRSCLYDGSKGILNPFGAFLSRKNTFPNPPPPPFSKGGRGGIYDFHVSRMINQSWEIH